MTESHESPPRVSAIVPARNEETVIAACVESLVAQKEVFEILVVNDQSSDRTAEILRELIVQHKKIRLLETKSLPDGWVGKNYAVWMGALEASGDWLLFTDADAVHEKESATKALDIASEAGAALVSFSPEQVMRTWYERALIPYVYCRLGSRYSFTDVNDPANPVAAANGQFLMMRRDAYKTVGGHAVVAGEILEDVALSKRVKAAGYKIWFGSGKGFVRVRMYRSFRALWEGWEKNLYPLMGGTTEALAREIVLAVVPAGTTLIASICAGATLGSLWAGLATVALGLGAIAVADGPALRQNRYSPRLVWHTLVGRLLFASVLWASYRAYKRGKLEWKGREYPADTPGASNG